MLCALINVYHLRVGFGGHTSGPLISTGVEGHTSGPLISTGVERGTRCALSVEVTLFMLALNVFCMRIAF